MIDLKTFHEWFDAKAQSLVHDIDDDELTAEDDGKADPRETPGKRGKGGEESYAREGQPTDQPLEV